MPKPRLQQDRGWAWLVMAGNFVNIVVVLSFVRALAILLPVFLAQYRQSVAATTLAFGIAEIMESLANLLIPAVFLPRFAVRTLCLCGAAANAGSIMALAFTGGHVALLNALFGCIGFSRGFMLNPQIFILGCYFRRRLSFANACANMGIGVATLLAPQAARLLLQAYGLQWTFLIFGACSLNSVTASLLFRPTSKYMREGDMKEEEEEAGSKSSSSSAAEAEEKESSCVACDEPADGTKAAEDEIESFSSCSHRDHLLPMNGCHDDDGYYEREYDGHRQRKSQKRQPSQSHQSQRSENQPQSQTKCREAGSLLFDSESGGAGGEERREADDDDDYHYCEFTPADGAEAGVSRGARRWKKMRGFKHWARGAWSRSVFAQPVSVLLIIATGVGVHTQAGNVYFPVLGLENGLTNDQLPWLLTITGATDIAGKLSMGLLADKGNCLSPLHLVCLTQAVAGVALLAAPFCRSMAAMSATCAAYGLTAGIMHILLPTLVVRHVGLEGLPRVVSGYYLLNCAVTFAMHVVVGSVKDVTGSFAGGFRFVGSLLLASVVVLLLVRPVSGGRGKGRTGEEEEGGNAGGA